MTPPAGPLDADGVRARLAGQQWTAHNLELAPGVWTLPGQPGFLETNANLQSILGVLRTVFPAGLAGRRVADLGCLEGGYSLALARRGAEVVGVEARPENLDKCELVRAQSPGLRLEFAGADVKDFTAARFGSFDVVLALGILYHLDDPVSWIRQVAEATRTLLLLDTHFAPLGDLAGLDPRLSGLGGLETRTEGGESWSGRWFHEYETREQRDGMPWASWSNPRSFWLTKQSLLSAVHTAGFGAVWEVHDAWTMIYDRLQGAYPRCRVAALRPGGAWS
jgi:SAM-dependent methyltransferase